jgi:hypothetical protein
MRVYKNVKHASLATIGLLVLVVVVGVSYTIYMGRNVKDTALAKPAIVVPTDVNPIKPPIIGANVPEGAAIETLTSPAVIGDTATVNVNTNPKSTCTIAVVYNEIPSKSTGLIKKQADDFGVVNWTWKIEAGTPNGSWPVNITCAYKDKSAFVQGKILITDK